MPEFIVNSNHDHEVHDMSQQCGHLPDQQNREPLGIHPDCHSAVSKAKKKYPSANGCFWCAKACHTT